jgi:hypothetical protein
MALIGCGDAPVSPEDRIRATLAEAEEAAEQRNARTAKALVSEAYADARGRTKRDIDGLVAFHVLRNRDAHLLTRVARIDFESETEARVVAWVAMAGRPIEGLEDLPGLRADLVRFDLRLRDEDWRVTGADWRRASLSEFGGEGAPPP